MKKLILLFLILPALSWSQGTQLIKVKRVISDSMQLTKMVTDTSTLSLVVDANGKFRVHRLTSGSTYDTTYLYTVLAGKQDTGQYLTAVPAWIQDTLDRHTDTLQAHNLRINAKSDTSHNHALNNLSEKSYNSLTDKPTLYDTTTSAFTKSAGKAYTRTGVTGVGIQRSNPTATLEVNSKSASAAQFRTYNSMLGEANPSDSLGIFVDSKGYVGIGTTAPGYGLDVASNMRCGFQLNLGIYGLVNYEELRGTKAGDFIVKNSSTNAASAMSFWTKNIEAMRINPSQMVGIGTTNPLAKLHVSGGVMMNGTDTTGVGSAAKVGTMMYYNGHFYGLKPGSPPAWTQLDN